MVFPLPTFWQISHACALCRRMCSLRWNICGSGRHHRMLLLLDLLLLQTAGRRQWAWTTHRGCRGRRSSHAGEGADGVQAFAASRCAATSASTADNGLLLLLVVVEGLGLRRGRSSGQNHGGSARRSGQGTAAAAERELLGRGKKSGFRRFFQFKNRLGFVPSPFPINPIPYYYRIQPLDVEVLWFQVQVPGFILLYIQPPGSTPHLWIREVSGIRKCYFSPIFNLLYPSTTYILIFDTKYI
jgi:hypothetical protein